MIDTRPAPEWPHPIAVEQTALRLSTFAPSHTGRTGANGAIDTCGPHRLHTTDTQQTTR